MQRRIEEPDDDRQAVHRLEDPLEVALLELLELRHRGVEGGDRLLLVGVERLARRGLRLGAGRLVRDEDRVTHDLEALALAEHVLGAAQPDALRTIAPRLGGLGLVGVRPDLHPANAVGPAEDRLQLGLVLESSLDRRQLAEVQGAGGAVEADPVTPP